MDVTIIDGKLTRDSNTHYRLNGKPKIKYNTENEAVLHCYETNMQDKQKYKMVAYKCNKCQAWHIGNSKHMLTSDEKEKIRKKYKQICIKLTK